MVEAVRNYVVSGGLVMPALLAVGMSLWTTLALWWQHLTRGFAGDVERRLAWLGDHKARGRSPAEAARGWLDAVLRRALGCCGAGTSDLAGVDVLVLEAQRELGGYGAIARALCTVAPLLGLLGTVGGMVETFAGLSQAVSYGPGGGIAGGISEALISTQLGLLVAIPGLVVTRLLEQRAAALNNDLLRAREILAAQVRSHAGWSHAGGHP